MLTITIENLLHFLEYFDDKIISMKNFPLGFVKVQSTHLILLVFCTNVERLEREKIVQIFSAIFNLVTWFNKSSLFQVFSFIKCYRHCANGSHTHRV